MDEAGVDYAVAPGSNGSVGPRAIDLTGTRSMIVSEQTLVNLRKSFNSRLFGLHGMDLSLSTNELVSRIEDAVTKYGLYAAMMEPGHFTAPEGGTLTADHLKVYPLYEPTIKGGPSGLNNWPAQLCRAPRYPSRY
jgi:hypothetical protein